MHWPGHFFIVMVYMSTFIIAFWHWDLQDPASMREDYNNLCLGLSNHALTSWRARSILIYISKQEEIQAIPIPHACAHVFWVSEYFSENTLHQLHGEVGDAFVNNIVWMVAMRPSSSLVPEPCFLNTTRICLSSCFSHLAHHRHVLLGCHVLPKTKGETWPNRSRAQAQSSIQCITLHKLHYPA